MKQLLFLSTLAFALMACSSHSDDPQPEPGAPVEIRLAADLSGTTRAYPTQGTVIEAGQTVYVWLDDVGDATADPVIPASEHVKAWTLTAVAPVAPATAGTLTSPNKHYFPASGRTVNAYAVHGNFATAPTEDVTSWDTFVTGLQHSVNVDQSTTANYCVSDLLYAQNTNIARDNTVKLLPFSHLLSKMVVELLPGNGVTAADLVGATVHILNTIPTADVTLSKTAAPSVAIDATVAAAPIAMLMDGTKGEAIVIPQTLTNKQLIEVRLAIGRSLYTAPSGYTFAPNTKYSYTITVNAKDLEMAQQITDWSAGTDTAVDVY